MYVLTQQLGDFHVPTCHYYRMLILTCAKFAFTLEVRVELNTKLPVELGIIAHNDQFVSYFGIRHTMVI